jgi:predicted permease
MDPHRVRRVADVLVVSQLRSGRSDSNARSFLGRSSFVAIVDVAVFGVTALLATFALQSAGSGAAALAGGVGVFLPLLPLVAVAAVLIAGVMFELTTTAKFTGSDAVNWLPLRPSEYVTASSCAIAYTYSPAAALALGATLPFAVVGGELAAWAFAAGLAGVALFEGAFLVEMVRAATQRASSVSVGGRGRATLVLRAALMVVILVVLQLAFNPVFLLGALNLFAGLGLVGAIVPLFWGTEAVVAATNGAVLVALGFAALLVAFTLALLAAAVRLRGRNWVVAPMEIRLEAIDYAAGHPALRALGLTAAESALVSKDLRGFVRRRELLPLLIVPIILIALVLIEGQSLGLLSAILSAGWITGFFALLLSVSSVGQERKALQALFAFPLSARSVLRAKAVSVLLPALIAAVGLATVVAVRFGQPLATLGGLMLLTVGAAIVLAFWGLVWASRYSDFQDRPRPQFLRPGAMVAATFSGMVVLFAIVVPGAFALQSALPTAAAAALASAAIAVALGATAVVFARSGFDRLFRELPF